MSAKKKKSSYSRDKSEGNGAIAKFMKNHLLIVCVFIALLDLVHGVFFVVQATISLIINVNVYSILALCGSIFWVLMVLVLLVGLIKRYPAFVRIWLIFSILGYIADIAFLIWGVCSTMNISWEYLNKFMIVFIGICIESVFIYIVYVYYLEMDACRYDVFETEKGSKRKKLKDPKACKESQREKKKAEKKKKKSAKKSGFY